ncbi:hypothetical protein K2173_025121 [Erythroxylum novogranatense]|uniref:FAF domain-containing protein n=1 Tax=Erythroxylum novogranatense TaxID=1862640 RepID=A0AAV8SWM2_9ROSI|nr:hypothetical protein K2173_025121 [Erythroxylum novogranatense]
MDTHSFCSLKDILSPPSPNKQNVERSESMSSDTSLSSHSTTAIAELLDGLSLSLEKNPLSPDNCSHEITVPLPVSPSKLSSSLKDHLFPESSINGNGNSVDDETMAEKKRIMNNTCLYLGNSPVCADSNRLFPPPISSLKLVKKGKSVVFINCKPEENCFVVDKVRVPLGGMFAASREGGRLKLYFAPPQADDEEKEEISFAKDDDEADGVEEEENWGEENGNLE